MLNDTSLPLEQWKNLPNNEYYLVSNKGRIWSIRKQRVMQTFAQNSGYLQVQLYQAGTSKRWLVHRLVAIVWVANPDNKKYVNHINGNKQDNSIENLEWCTNSENILHARKTGLNPYNNPMLNKKLSGLRRGSSLFHGVCWDVSRKQWRSAVVHAGKIYYQKRFNTEIDAAKFYDKCVISLGLQRIKTLNNI